MVGQEFSDVGTYIKTEGKVERYPEKYEYPSNKNLNEFCSLIGLDVGHPYAPNRTNPVFFTNAVMALKSGAMSANFKDSWLKESREAVSYTHLRAHEPVLDLVCRLLFEKKTQQHNYHSIRLTPYQSDHTNDIN